MALSWKLLSFIFVLWVQAQSGSLVPPPQPAATFGPHGGAFVTTLPASASAWLDGTYVGQTPLYVDDLSPGRHGVTLSRTGWQPQTATFDVYAGRVTPVSLVMQRVAQTVSVASSQFKGQGTLAIRGGPAGGKIYVDGVVVGTLPVDARSVEAGYHIVSLQPPAKNEQKSTRIVNVFPDSVTAVTFTPMLAGAPPANPADDILEPIDAYVPLTNVIVAGNDVTIHFRGTEVECAIGSRSYTFNGRAGTLAVAPAVVGGKVYLPLSLLQRLARK